MPENTLFAFDFPAVGRKKVVAAFDGGRLTSDGGVMLLSAFERELDIARTLAALIPDARNPLLVTHSVEDILRARMLAIACGYEDADDLDHLRTDPGFKLACGRFPHLPFHLLRRRNLGQLRPTAALTCARSRPFRAGKTRLTCAR
jgi:hypothetical protein